MLAAVSDRPAYSIVLSTFPDAEAAGRVARALVEEGLAACVSVVPGVRSFYRWRGSIEESEEVLIIAKTTSAALGELIRRVRELHPYELPEIISVDASGGLPEYLSWISESVRPDLRGGRAPDRAREAF
ncbi:MAG: divalent-cation tolerance protein CutA [Thaumarchaeota archaeon]|jgi:periplasmic divalent cation tolerance protein|nr:divalent-cation tolerance protein CutA [Nitrososphaerota archaeon]